MSLPASPTSLRARLREATTHVHARVDAQLGEMRDADHYRAYLRGMHGFLAAVTPGLSSHAGALGWSPPQWRSELDADLQTVHAAPLACEAMAVGNRDEAMGLLYVIEGSALGARLLLRRACALGYEAGRGTAFLHRHADVGTTRWPAFLALLAEWEPRIDAPAACDAALAGFAVADRCFHRAQEAMA
jgi:heme oxygenase